jgi:type I restriction enzyme S subunit
MSRVHLGDVAIEHKETCKEDKSMYPIVGLEHLTPEQITLQNWDLNTENTFTKVFRKGNILFGRRRAYLKKAAVAPFDGICSGDITVIEAKEDKIIPELLPFVIQNDDLFDFAVGKSAGSLSPRVKWTHLQNYEFELPDKQKQHELAKVLWAIEDTRKSYQQLIKRTDELVKSQFIELFGQLPEHFKHETVELGNIADMLSGGTPSSKHPEYYGDKYPFVTTPCLGKNYIDESDAVNWLSEIGVKKSSTHIIPANSVMYGSRVGVGKSSINTCKMCTNQDILSFFNIDESKYDLLFIKKVMDQYFDYIDTQKRGATIKGVPSDIVKAIKIPVVPIDEQHAFAEFTEQSDKSKFELNRALDELTATYKQIIKDYLG